MADRKISDLTALTTPATGDLIPIVDVSEAAAADKNKSITVQELFKGAPDGTAAAPGIAFESDDGNGIFLAGTDQVGVATGGVERVEFGASEVVFNDGGADYDFRIEGDTDTALFFVDASTDRIGIGTSSPSALFSVFQSAEGEVANFGTSDTSRLLRVVTGTANSISGALITLKTDSAEGEIAFGTGGGSERVRIDSTGRLLHGTSASVTANSETRNVQIVTDVNNANQGLGIYAFTASNNAPRLDLGSSPNDTINTFTTVSSDGGLCGRINFLGSDGDEFLPTARIESRVDGTAGNGDMPGRLTFLTTANSASAPTARMTIDNGGLVGIGTTDPNTLIDARGSGPIAQVTATDQSSARVRIQAGNTSQSYLEFGDSDDSDIGEIVYDHSNNSMRFRTNGTAQAYIDSSGRLLVGRSSAPANDQGNVSKLIVQGYVGANTGLGLLSLQRGDGNSSITEDEVLGRVSFNSSEGNAYCYIQGVADANAGTNDYPGRLVFATNVDGGAGINERMRIDSGGVVYIGQSASSIPGAGNTTTGHTMRPGGDAFHSIGGAPAIYANRNTSTGNIVSLRYNGTERGSISTDGTVIAYNTSSDYRLKENIAAVTDGIARLKQLKPSRFNFISNPAKTVDGFIAHEIQDIVPEAVTGEKDAVDEEGNPEYQGIDQAKLVPLLTAALQEAIAKIETLETKVAALEAS